MKVSKTVVENFHGGNLVTTWLFDEI